MSSKHNKILLAIAGLEVVAVSVLLAWAIGHKTTPAPGTSHKPAAQHRAVALMPELLTTGLQAPTSIASTNQAGDTRLFVTEQGGTIQTVGADGKLAAQAFLDISGKVKNSGEMGLLGLAFAPNYKQTGYFYVDYVDASQTTVIARYHVAPQSGLADAASEKVILSVKQPPYPNHKGGQLAFGPDGDLYIALGDGGSAGDPGNRAQDKTTLLGKILRIDVTHGDPYRVPASNPFASDASAKPEIWAYGLRNPWRFSFDKTTGDLYIADVGQDKIEELDVQKAASKGGENYGWRCYEGEQQFNHDGCQDASHYVSPVLSYAHDEGRCSITGGYVYRGAKIPDLRGKYVYADFCGGQIYYATSKGGKFTEALAAHTPYSINTFGQDNAGELYFADFKTGSLYRLTQK